MTLCPPLDHEGLLTLARKLEGAVSDGDRDRLATAAQRLSEALVDHVGAERPALLQLPADESLLLLRGQQRVMDLVVDLTHAAENPGPCRCPDVARQLLAQLTLQAGDERRSLVPPANLPSYGD